MGKKSKPDIKYANEIINEWQKAGGLILQAEASRMLNVSETQINNLAKKNELMKIKVHNKKYIGFSKLFELIEKRKEEK